jgi:hypothetical protein
VSRVLIENLELETKKGRGVEKEEIFIREKLL